MEILNLLQFGLIVKLFFSVLALFYFIFAVIVYRQIVLMTQVLDSHLSPVLKTVALVQIAGVGLLFFIGVVLV